ncbi:MAG TPA: MlaD family protein [Usitatibacter sp.]|nr:MlaD family protein [Usitatibacter sp.]
MSDPTTPDSGVPSAVARRPGMRWVQPVWIIPAIAILIAGWLTLQHFLDRGPTITIRFRTAEGLEAGKTRIKYKEVDIGTVKQITLDRDRKGVIVTASMVKEASSGLLVTDTRFWVVRPRISGGRVSGLGTLLAGAYIGSDPGHASEEKRDFEGLETPPAVTADVPGSMFRLSAEDLGSIDIGSPLYFRGVSAGQVASTEVSKDGGDVIVSVFVNAPFDQFVTPASRFWNASGIDFALDANGLKVDTESVVTVLVGGIAFDNPAGVTTRANKNDLFVLWRDRSDAMKKREKVVETYTMRFDQTVRGLNVGAPVDFRGVEIGEVSRIDLEYLPEKVNFRTVVEMKFFPERLGPLARNGSHKAEDIPADERMRRFVGAGFRGQLRNGNLLTGQLYVALDFFPNAPPATMDYHVRPPEIPTVPGTLAELQDTIARILKRIDKVPFDVIGEDLRKALEQLKTTLQQADTLAKHLDSDVTPELKRTLEQARRTLADAQKTMAEDSPIQADLRDTLEEMKRSSEELRALVDFLERHPDALIRGRRQGEQQ